jgi:hypothetical protein
MNQNSNSAPERRIDWWKIRMSKALDGVFEVTVDELPGLKCCARTSDAALLTMAHALERLDPRTVAGPNKGIYTWEEYACFALYPMGKMPFAELAFGQRFLRKGFPTMWDKLSPSGGTPLDGTHEIIFIPPDEIVWHHVWALSDELTPSEKQERIEWSGNPALHF